MKTSAQTVSAVSIVSRSEAPSAAPVRVSAAATLRVGLGRLRSSLEPRPLVLALQAPHAKAPQKPMTRARFEGLWVAAEKRYGESRNPDATVAWLAGQLGMGPSAHPHLWDALVTGDFSVNELWTWHEWKQEPRPRFEALWADAEIRYAESREADQEVTRLIGALGLGEDARFHLTDALITGDFSTEELWNWYQIKKGTPRG